MKLKKKVFNTNRIFIGGSLNVGFSSYSFQVGGAPEISYSITNWLDAGLGFNLNYYSERADPYYNGGLRYHNFNYGGGPFFRVYPLPFLFLQGQFEHNWVKVNQKYMPDGPDTPALLHLTVLLGALVIHSVLWGKAAFIHCLV